MDIDTNLIREGYDQWASVYDSDSNPMPALEEPIVRKAVGNPEGCIALDLGCGTGRHASWLSQSGAEVTAVDFSFGMLEKAKQKPEADKIQFLQHDLNEKLTWECKFDLIVSGLVLEHIADIAAFFVQIKQMLRPSGRAIVSSMHPAMFLKGSKARFTDPETGTIIAPGSYDHSISDTVMAALHAGLKLEEITELSPDTNFAETYPRAEKYVGWPMVVVYSFSNPQ